METQTRSNTKEKLTTPLKEEFGVEPFCYIQGRPIAPRKRVERRCSLQLRCQQKEKSQEVRITSQPLTPLDDSILLFQTYAIMQSFYHSLGLLLLSCWIHTLDNLGWRQKLMRLKGPHPIACFKKQGQSISPSQNREILD